MNRTALACFLLSGALAAFSAAAPPTTSPVKDSAAMPAAAAAEVIVRTYDVHTLLDPPQDYPLTVAMAPTVPGSSDSNMVVPGGGGGSLFGGGAVPAIPTNADVVRGLIKIIEDTVSSDSWKDNGGAVGSVQEFGGRLSVAQTEANQAKVQALLESLSSNVGHTVRTSARWVLMNKDQAADLQKHSSGEYGAIDDQTLNQLPIYWDGTIVGFDGQTVRLSAVKEHTYISNATPVVAASIAAYTPTLSTIRDGVALQVKPSIEGDVALIDVLSIVGKVTGLTSDPIAMHATTDPSTEPADCGLVQRPLIDAQQIHTTVKVPLGKDVLLGGMSQVSGDTTPSAQRLCLVIRVDRQ